MLQPRKMVVVVVVVEVEEERVDRPKMMEEGEGVVAEVHSTLVVAHWASVVAAEEG